jgi:hypothetical protein
MVEHLALGGPPFLQRRLKDNFCAQLLESRFEGADQARGLNVDLLGPQAGLRQ